MKKIIRIVASAFAIFNLSFCSLGAETEMDNEKILFRGHEWGETVENVKDTEITSDMMEYVDWMYTDGFLLISNSNVSTFDATLSFVFDDDERLTHGGYMLSDEYSNEADYFTMFSTLESLYEEKYGSPAIAKEQWKDETYKGNQNMWGKAALDGDVEFLRIWQADDSSCIFMTLDSNNCSILYYSEGLIG